MKQIQSIVKEKGGGIITQVMGPVVDVSFPDGAVPAVYTKLVVKNNEGKVVALEV